MSSSKAKRDFHNLVKENEITIRVFDVFGEEFLKSASLAPDAFMQMILQLASYRLFGKQVAVYESSHVRSFLHGRTETTRSVSPASRAFVDRMGLQPKMNEDSEAREDKLSLLKTAIWAHSKYLNKASKGLGCDRHFFGLSMLLHDNELKPTLFDDPLFKRSCHWQVSSSTLPHVPGFGCVVDDGIGIGYNLDSYRVEFIVAARTKANIAHKFGNLIEEALHELKSLIDEGEVAEK